MPLESATFIDGLNAANPVGSTDKVQTLDDHVRLIKSTVKATFPNLAGAVNFTHTVANYLVGVTSAVQTQLDGKAATAHNHSAAELTSGTIPDARFPATLPALSGVNLTALNASNLGSGTVPAARLTLAAVLASANTFAADQTISKATARMVLISSGAQAAAVRFETNSALRGFMGAAGASSMVAGDAAGDMVVRAESGSFLFSGDGGTTAHFKLSAAGVLTTPLASAAEPGVRGAIARAISASNSTVSTDGGNCVLFNGGSGQTFTLDGDPPTNSVIVLVNESGNPWTIAASSSLIFAGVTGSRTLPNGCMAVAYHRQGGGVWQIAGQLT